MNENSKSVRILDLIEERGGMRFTDIQAALWGMTHSTPFTREVRGYWCTNLLGGPFYHAGLLRFFCDRGKDGLWRRNDIPHRGAPWRTMNLTKYAGRGWRIQAASQERIYAPK